MLPTTEIRWFQTKSEYLAFSEHVRPNALATEAYIGQLNTFNGYCHCCERMTDFVVSVGAFFADRPSLREGLRCMNCGLSNRSRLLYLAVMSEMALPVAPQVLLLERLSALHDRLQAKVPSLIGSEYLGDAHERGNVYRLAAGDVRHESATRLSFSDGALDLIVHNDILEHIPDYRAALRESHRVLKKGGRLLFICPFFASRSDTLVRAKVHRDGQIEHLEPQEIHGDPLSDSGILAFYHFGWDLLGDLSSAGFSDVRIGVAFDPMAGLTSNNFPNDPYGWMLPSVFRCEK